MGTKSFEYVHIEMLHEIGKSGKYLLIRMKM